MTVVQWYNSGWYKLNSKITQKPFLKNKLGLESVSFFFPPNKQFVSLMAYFSFPFSKLTLPWKLLNSPAVGLFPPFLGTFLLVPGVHEMDRAWTTQNQLLPKDSISIERCFFFDWAGAIGQHGDSSSPSTWSWSPAWIYCFVWFPWTDTYCQI